MSFIFFILFPAFLNLPDFPKLFLPKFLFPFSLDFDLLFEFGFEFGLFFNFFIILIWMFSGDTFAVFVEFFFDFDKLYLNKLLSIGLNLFYGKFY